MFLNFDQDIFERLPGIFIVTPLKFGLNASNFIMKPLKFGFLVP